MLINFQKKKKKNRSLGAYGYEFWTWEILYKDIVDIIYQNNHSNG